MQPTCPRGSYLLSSYTICGYSCGSGNVTLYTDDSFCVGQSCPSQTNIDAGDNSVCWKVPTPKVGTCPTGTTEWTPNQCYTDCPAGFRENGRSCLIPTVKRRITQPVCSFLFSLQGDTCQPTYFFVLLCLSAVIFVGFAFYSKSCRIPQEVQYVTRRKN
jgi:hypothetical protein